MLKVNIIIIHDSLINEYSMWDLLLLEITFNRVIKWLMLFEIHWMLNDSNGNLNVKIEEMSRTLNMQYKLIRFLMVLISCTPRIKVKWHWFWPIALQKYHLRHTIHTVNAYELRFSRMRERRRRRRSLDLYSSLPGWWQQVCLCLELMASI